MVFRVARPKRFGDIVFQILSEKATLSTLQKNVGGGNRRQREYAVFCFLGTSLDIQGQSIYVSVLSTPQWTVQAKTKKNGTLQMRIPCSSVVVQHGKSSCCGHLRPLCHRVTAKIYRGIRSAMTNYLRMPQLEHRFPYCFEYINMFRQK